jgi:hypothetical protein
MRPSVLCSVFASVSTWLALAQSLSWTQPSLSLCCRNPGTASGAHLPAFGLAGGHLGRGGGLRGGTGQHGTKFGDLCVDSELLLFKTDDGGVDYFGSEF